MRRIPRMRRMRRVPRVLDRPSCSRQKSLAIGATSLGPTSSWFPAHSFASSFFNLLPKRKINHTTFGLATLFPSVTFVENRFGYRNFPKL